MTTKPLAFSADNRPRFNVWHLALAIIAFFGVLAVLFPVIWMFFASIRPTTETLSYPPVWFPQQITFIAYQKLLADPVQSRFLINTYIIAFSTALISIGLGSLAAYGFSRYRIRGGNVILAGILSLQMLPSVTLIIPFFNLSQVLHIHNTFPMLTMADTAFALPISIWILKSYLDGLPVDLEEAAMVDGCNRLQVLWRVVLPLALPGLVGTATFAFLYAWSEFTLAVVLTQGPNVAPVTIAISQFMGQYGRQWENIMALNALATLPLLLIFIFLQRWVVQGITAGAVK